MESPRRLEQMSEAVSELKSSPGGEENVESIPPPMLETEDDRFSEDEGDTGDIDQDEDAEEEEGPDTGVSNEGEGDADGENEGEGDNEGEPDLEGQRNPSGDGENEADDNDTDENANTATTAPSGELVDAKPELPKSSPMLGMTESEIRAQQAALATEYSHLARVLSRALERRVSLTLKRLERLERKGSHGDEEVQFERPPLTKLGKLLSYQISSIQANSRNEALNIWRDFYRQKMDLREKMSSEKQRNLARLQKDYTRSPLLRNTNLPVLDWISANLDIVHYLRTQKPLASLEPQDALADIKLMQKPSTLMLQDPNEQDGVNGDLNYDNDNEASSDEGAEERLVEFGTVAGNQPYAENGNGLAQLTAAIGSPEFKRRKVNEPQRDPQQLQTATHHQRPGSKPQAAQTVQVQQMLPPSHVQVAPHVQSIPVEQPVAQPQSQPVAPPMAQPQPVVASVTMQQPQPIAQSMPHSTPKQHDQRRDYNVGGSPYSVKSRTPESKHARHGSLSKQEEQRALSQSHLVAQQHGPRESVMDINSMQQQQTQQHVQHAHAQPQVQHHQYHQQQHSPYQQHQPHQQPQQQSQQQQQQQQQQHRHVSSPTVHLDSPYNRERLANMDVARAPRSVPSPSVPQGSQAQHIQQPSLPPTVQQHYSSNGPVATSASPPNQYSPVVLPDPRALVPQEMSQQALTPQALAAQGIVAGGYPYYSGYAVMQGYPQFQYASPQNNLHHQQPQAPQGYVYGYQNHWQQYLPQGSSQPGAPWQGQYSVWPPPPQ